MTLAEGGHEARRDAKPSEVLCDVAPDAARAHANVAGVRVSRDERALRSVKPAMSVFAPPTTTT